jgi:tetratricopeptide (TPR) repeat protein
MNRLIAVFFVLLTCLFSFAAKPAEIDGLVQRGDAAAHDDRHTEAIASYEAAIRLDRSARNAILPKLAQQYLWSNNAVKAIDLFAEHLQSEPQDCDVRMAFALAFSWANRLENSREQYEIVRKMCPDRTTEARLGEARVLRWMDRPREADAAYGDVIWSKDPWKTYNPDYEHLARLGIAQDSLAMDDNHSSQRLFAELIKSGSKDPAVFEGEAVSALHLGVPDQTLAALQAAKQAGIRDDALNDLEEHTLGIDRPTLSPAVTGFNDNDGTTYRAAELKGGFGWRRRSRAEITTGASRLVKGDQAIQARWGGITLEKRFNPSWAVRAESRLTEYSGTDFKPLTIELNGIWTPRDGSRVDVTAARIQESDNLAALRNGLAGTFVSVGTDERLTDHNSVSLSVDSTHWNQGSVRTRYRLNPSRHFERLHGIRIELPTLFQTYNHGFAFQLFSPRRYIESGPGIAWSRWYRHHWQLSLYGRLGVQRESEASWKGLGTFEAKIDRELWKSWGFQCATSWSSSSLASPTGFRRRSFTVGFDHRF